MPRSISTEFRGSLPQSNQIRETISARKSDLNVFDCVIGNLDRHDGNYLGRVDDGMVIPIDHGLSFPERHGDQGWHNHLFRNDGVRLTDAQAAGLTALVERWHSLEQVFQGLNIASPAIALARERVDMMLVSRSVTYSWAQLEQPPKLEEPDSQRGPIGKLIQNIRAWF